MRLILIYSYMCIMYMIVYLTFSGCEVIALTHCVNLLSSTQATHREGMYSNKLLSLDRLQYNSFLVCTTNSNMYNMRTVVKDNAFGISYSKTVHKNVKRDHMQRFCVGMCISMRFSKMQYLQPRLFVWIHDITAQSYCSYTQINFSPPLKKRHEIQTT